MNKDDIPQDVRQATGAVFDCPNRETFEENFRHLHKVWQKYEPQVHSPKLKINFNFPTNDKY